MGSVNLDTNWGLEAPKYFFKFQSKSFLCHILSSSLRGNLATNYGPKTNDVEVKVTQPRSITPEASESK